MATATSTRVPTADPLRLASRLSGAMWGLLVGDAVGVPYEFGPARPAADVAFGAPGGPWRQPAGTWSDDGALALALLDSLLPGTPGRGHGTRTPRFRPEDQGRRFLAWRDGTAYTPDGDGRFDIGPTTAEALGRLADGVPALQAGPGGERSCGNGSLMRVLPLALALRDRPTGQLIRRAHEASRVTHGHPRCQVACAVYCVAVAGLLRGLDPADALARALDACGRAYRRDRGHAAHLAALAELRAHEKRTGSGYVLDSFWSAWDAFAGASGYADAVRRAVAYGNDTDTTAAIAGGLAGARWGWEAIPAEWRRGMRGSAVAQPIIDRLVETVDAGAGSGPVRTSSGSPLRVDLLDLAGTALEGTGRVGITFLPGKKRDGQSGPHWRDLGLDLARLRDQGVDALFLLVEDDELAYCGSRTCPR